MDVQPALALALPALRPGPRWPLSLSLPGGQGHLAPTLPHAGGITCQPSLQPSFSGQGLVGCAWGKEKELLVISCVLSLLCLTLLNRRWL